MGVVALGTSGVMMAKKNQVEFYDVKKRERISVDTARVAKTTVMTGDGRTLYGLRARTADGRMLTKLVSQSEWEAADLPPA